MTRKTAWLEDRGVVRVRGEDAPGFLQGLLTNDVDGLAPGEARYAALLTPQGKILFDLLVAPIPAAEGAAYFAVVGCLEAVPPGSPRLDVVVRREDHTLAVDVVGVDLRHADAMLGSVRRLEGAIDIAGGPDVGTITLRIPCE